MDYPGEKLLLKLWETLAEKGVGSLLAPWQEKRLSRARTEIRREELLVIAQAEKEVESIKSGKSVYPINDGVKLLTTAFEKSDEKGRIEPTIELSHFAVKASSIEVSESVRKEVNVAKAVMIAEDILAQDAQESSNKPIEDDWLFSWRENAGRVSTDELQDLWGRVLAGEVKQPGTYSIRTLEFLKSLSKAEAELISKAAGYVIADRIYRNKEEFLEKDGLNFTQLLFLQDIGILSGVEASGISTTYKSIEPDRYFKPLVANSKIMLLEHEDSSKEVKAEIYLLTRVGAEVLRLASFRVNQEYFESVAKDFATKGFKVKVADWVQQTSESGQFFNAVDIAANA
jgi:hypothetical protein